MAIEIIMGEQEEFRRYSIKGDTVRGSNKNKTFTQETVVHVLVQESMVNYFKLRPVTPVAVTLLWSYMSCWESLATDLFSLFRFEDMLGHYVQRRCQITSF